MVVSSAITDTKRSLFYLAYTACLPLTYNLKIYFGQSLMPLIHMEFGMNQFHQDFKFTTKLNVVINFVLCFPLFPYFIIVLFSGHSEEQ